MLKFLFLTLFFPALVLANFFEQPAEGTSVLDLSTRWKIEEREHEDNTRVIDEREYSFLLSRLAFKKTIVDSLSFGAAINYSLFGTHKKMFAEPSLLNTGEIDFYGLRSIELQSQYLSTDKNLALEIHLEGTLQRARERNASLGGFDGKLIFKYLHELGNFQIGGKLFSSVIGKKRVFRKDGEREIVDPYNQFGNELTLISHFSNWTISLSGHFLLATDYVVRSPSYTRSSDKGFGVGGKLNFAYSFNAKEISFWHERSNQVFNVITIDPSQQFEYEIEEQSTGLGFKWLY
tara:strand:- start:2341 stop:3213 length:873 start_codon:yes stop_codon:yes gene_type:complete